VTTIHGFGGVLGQLTNTFFLGTHNFMVTALGLCVKWPLITRIGVSWSRALSLMCEVALNPVIIPHLSRHSMEWTTKMPEPEERGKLNQ
jgi:hypothetical protein